MSFKTRVEDYLGTTYADTTALDNWLTSEGRKLVDLVPLSKAEKYIASVSDSGSGAGANITDYRVINAHKSGIGAKRINASEYSRVSNANSIYYADANSPMFYINNNKGYILPGGGTFLAISKGSIANNDSSFVIPELEEALVLGTAIKAVLGFIASRITSINGYSIDSVAKPVVPSSPSFTYTDVTYGSDVSYTDAEYTHAVYTNALIDTISATTIESLGTAPTYTKQVTPASFGVATTLISTDEDVELANAELGKIKTQLEQYQMELYNELNKFNGDSLEYNAELQKKIQQAQLDQQRLIAQTQSQIELNKFNAQQAIQTLLANENAESNVDATNKAKTLETAVFNKSKSIEVDIINKSKELERQIVEYANKLQVYQSEIGQYQADIGKAIQEYTAKIQGKSSEIQGYIPLLQTLKNEYNEIIQTFINS